MFNSAAKTRKILFRVVLLLAVTVLLSSCFTIPRTHKMIVDEYSPAERNATVTFVSSTRNGWFIFKEWNSINLQEALYGKRGTSSADKAILTVPAGTNTFTFDMRFTFSNQYSSTTYRIEDVELRYDLEAGEKYQVKGRHKFLGFLGFGGLELYVGIYNVTNKSVLLKEWQLKEAK